MIWVPALANDKHCHHALFTKCLAFLLQMEKAVNFWWAIMCHRGTCRTCEDVVINEPADDRTDFRGVQAGSRRFSWMVIFIYNSRMEDSSFDGFHGMRLFSITIVKLILLVTLISVPHLAPFISNSLLPTLLPLLALSISFSSSLSSLLHCSPNWLLVYSFLFYRSNLLLVFFFSCLFSCSFPPHFSLLFLPNSASSLAPSLHHSCWPSSALSFFQIIFLSLFFPHLFPPFPLYLSVTPTLCLSPISSYMPSYKHIHCIPTIYLYVHTFIHKYNAQVQPLWMQAKLGKTRQCTTNYQWSVWFPTVGRVTPLKCI